MKKVSLRAVTVSILGLLIIAGLVLYVMRYVKDGEMWATYFDNALSGSVCTVTDRNGVVLAKMGQGGKYYAEDAKTRTSCYHVIGDYGGNVGTGVVQRYLGEILNFNLITGIENTEDTNLALTIDSKLNKAAYDALDGRNGAVIISNYKTGEILCMVSSPAIDPLDPPETLPDGTYINRGISASFVPGSVFKLVTVTAAIEQISDIYDRTFTCSGAINVMGVRVTCTGIHGEQTIEQALANSCNCAFGKLALELGADTLAEYAKRLGITETHMLDDLKTAAGNFDKDESKSAALAWSGIGQYNDLVCPYSLLRIVSGIANGGTVVEPSLVGTSDKETKLISQSTAEKVAAMMNYNVAYHYGTDRFPGLKISAKTGTAETGDGKDPHGWFAGFLADSEHPYAFVVLVENGGSGLHSAGAVANTVLQTAVKQE